MISVLYVDDEPGLLEIGKLFLEQSGQFQVDTTISATDALTMIPSKVYDAIISDYQMPGMDGIELLKTVRSSGNTIPFILSTGYSSEEIVGHSARMIYPTRRTSIMSAGSSIRKCMPRVRLRPA
ncbi:MAG: response regulator [Methanomicrobiales archaeon]